MPKKPSNTEARTLNPLPWIAGVLFILGLAMLGGLYWNRTNKVEKVQYAGFHYVTEKQLRDQVKIPTGISPDSLDVVGIMKKIEQLPYVKYVRLSPEPGGTMDVNITERSPIALLVDGQQRTYVDSEGVRLPYLPGETPDVPLLYGFRATPMRDTLNSKAFKQAGLFLQALQKRKASDATISEVAWNDKEGIITLTNDNGVKVIFGKGNYDNRLRNWQAFCRNVVQKKGIKSMHSVDLRFKGQIVTREK